MVEVAGRQPRRLRTGGAHHRICLFVAQTRQLPVSRALARCGHATAVLAHSTHAVHRACRRTAFKFFLACHTHVSPAAGLLQNLHNIILVLPSYNVTTSVLHVSVDFISVAVTWHACRCVLSCHLVLQPQLVTSASAAPCSPQLYADVHAGAARSAARKPTPLGKVHTARSDQGIAHSRSV